MRRRGFAGALVTLARELRAIEISISQQCLRRVGSGFKKELLCPCKLQVVLADVLQPALRAEIAPRLVRRPDQEAAALARSKGDESGTFLADALNSAFQEETV